MTARGGGNVVGWLNPDLHREIRVHKMSPLATIQNEQRKVENKPELFEQIDKLWPTG